MQHGRLRTEENSVILQKLYERSRQKLYYIAWGILHNEADAEDAVHTCFLKIADKFTRYSHLSYDELERLCCTVVRNAATDIAREYEKKGNFIEGFNQDEDDLPDMAPDVLDQLIEKMERQDLVKALMQLDIQERDFLNMQYVLGLKPKVIGKLTGMSSEAVRKKIFRCRVKLAKILEKHK